MPPNAPKRIIMANIIRENRAAFSFMIPIATMIKTSEFSLRPIPPIEIGSMAIVATTGTIKINTNSTRIPITSLELELPDNVEFVDIGPSGYIDQGPGMSRGIYMWVSDNYYIDANGAINLIANLQGTAPGEGDILFRITTNDVYIKSDDIGIIIK